MFTFMTEDILRADTDQIARSISQMLKRPPMSADRRLIESEARIKSGIQIDILAIKNMEK